MVEHQLVVYLRSCTSNVINLRIMFVRVFHHQMDELTPTDKLSPLALAIMSQIGSAATTGFQSLLIHMYVCIFWNTA